MDYKGRYSKNVMIDIETLGTKSNSVILSICAVRFNIQTAEIVSFFEANIDIDDSLKHGLKVEGKTLLWWLKQSEEARDKVVGSKRVELAKALDDLRHYIKYNDYVWGNSASFDCGLLKDAYNAAGMKPSWDFRKEICFRTFSNLVPEIKENQEFLGVKHNPYDDAVHQIYIARKVWEKLGLK